MNINTARFHPRRALPPRLPRGSVAGRFGASVVPRRSVLFIFSENKYCQISSEAGLAPSGSPAALLPGDSAHPSCPGGLFYLFSPKINTARFHPRRALPPLAPLRLCCREIRRNRKAFSVLSLSYFYAKHKNTAKPYNPPPRCSGSAVGGSIFITPETASAYTACAEKCCRPSAGRSA